MPDNNTHQSVKERVFATIHSGKTRMKPRWHFVLRAALVAIGIFIMSIGIVYLASLIHFLLRQSGIWFAPALGMHGVGMLLLLLPWFLTGVIIAFLTILEVLVRRYTFAYKQPVMYSVIGIVAVVALATFVVAKTGVHGTLYRAARDGGLPVGASLYGPFPLGEAAEIHPGVITDISSPTSFTLERIDDTSLSVNISNETHTPTEYTPVLDDHVVVFGLMIEETITAKNIRPERDDAFIPFHENQTRLTYPLNISPEHDDTDDIDNMSDVYKKDNFNKT